jgi:recombination protein RecT
VPGWRGYVDLVHRSGRSVCWTGAVFEGDDFEYGMGDSPYVRHKPHGEDDPSKITHTYAVGRIRGIDWPIIEVFPRAKIEKHLKRYNRVGDKHYAYQNWEMYARKVPLLQVVKYLPASVELAQLVALEGAADSAASITLKDAIEGTVLTPYDEQTAAPALTQPEKNVAFDAEEIFGLADDAVKSKDFELARDLASKLPEAKRKMILDRCPKE